MKKIFYCACLAALATACTNDDVILEDSAKVSKGITLETGIENFGVNSRGELTSNYNFFWYAEDDRINVYADNVTGVRNVSDWESGLYTASLYKATQSASKGQFTSVDDANLLSFATDNYSYFVALYPNTTTLQGANNVETEVEGTNTYTSDMDIIINVGEDNREQNVNFNETKAPMVSQAYGKRNASYQSVGEKMSLKFRRPFPVLMASSANNSADLNEILGGLKSVTVTTTGATDLDGYSLPATKIAATSAEYDFEDIKTTIIDGEEYNVCNRPTLTSGDNSVKAIIVPTNQAWGEGQNVYLSIYPVNRLGSKPYNPNKQMAEKYSVEYEYANGVTLTKNFTTSVDWNIEHAVYELEELNVANDFDYIVTDAGVLYVFKAPFSQIYNEGKTAVDWNGGVNFDDIKQIISDVALSDTELQELKHFEYLEKLTLKANTSIPEDVFDVTLAGNITDLNLPLVTEFASTDNTAFSALVNLDMNSYEFANEDVHPLFFNDNVKNSLETLKIEAVTSLRPTFGYDRTIYFTDYTALKSIALNPNGVAVPAFGFKNCTALQSVTGKVDITNAPQAFYAAGHATNNPTINVISTIIPNEAFYTANIKHIKYQGAQVVPTEIGESAFRGNTKIEEMDLSQATTIGVYAFSGATNFVGNTATGNVLTVGAKVLNDYVLFGTKVVRVQFTAAQTLGHNLLGGNAALKQVKFLARVKEVAKKYNVTPEEDAVPFADLTTTGLDLFVKTNQSDINGLKWNLTGDTFKSVTKENVAFGE